MTGPTNLLAECEARGVRLIPAGPSDLTVRGPKRALTPDLIERLKAHKAELLNVLRPAQAGGDSRAAATMLALAPPKPVCRCGSTRWRDAPIHNGQSLRRDCGRCARFIDFPVWRGRILYQ